jgi:gamma-glutamylcyclotransferase (GGCT)/AIG2-like uncharacterized protein YtfP
MSYLFLYGTLRKDAPHEMNKALGRSARLIGTGYIQAQLYDLGEYPGAIPSQNVRHKVFGQIFEIIDDTIFTRLDDYEGCAPHDQPPFEFRREKMKVHGSSSNIHYAWVYLYNRSVANSTLILTGDYLSAR